MNRRYVKGRNFEWQVRDFFRSHGYWCQRSGGSKGESDLVAIKRWHVHFEGGPKVLLIQCKATVKGSDMQEKRRLKELATELNCVPVWASKTSTGKLLLSRLDGVPDFGW